MKKGRFELAVLAMRSLVLVMVLSLAALPFFKVSAQASPAFGVSTVEIMSAGQHEVQHDGHYMTSHDQLSKADLSFKTDTSNHNDADSCKVFCGAVFLLSEQILPDFFDPGTVYDELTGPAVLAGEYPAPYRPPNA